MRRWLPLVYGNFANLCVLLVLFELGGQALRYAWRGELLLATPPSTEGGQVFEMHPYLAGRPRANVRVEKSGTRISTTAKRTRAVDGAAPAPLRVAALGGSTTFGVGVSDGDTWPARLQAALGPRYEVTNYGVPGYSTAEAVIQMALIVPEDRPDVTIFYEGWNDIRNYHSPNLGADYYAHGMQQYTSLGLAEWQPDVAPRMLDRLAQVSVVARVARRLASFLPHPHAPVDAQSTPDEFVDHLYLRNLHTLRMLARSADSYALFVPQVLNDAGYAKLDAPADWTPHIAPAAVPALMRRLNGLMLDACAPGSADCSVLSSVEHEPWSAADFIDLGHFSPQGNEKFAQQVAAAVREARP